MAEPTKQTPPGWHVAGSARAAYVAGVDPNVARSGKPSGYLKSNQRRIDGFGTLMQKVAPQRYSGGRIRLSCHLKTKAVADWAGLWCRVDHLTSAEPLAFDNMEDRPIKGTTPWTECAVVLDVPAAASNIAFGVLLSGNGTVCRARARRPRPKGPRAPRTSPQEPRHSAAIFRRYQLRYVPICFANASVSLSRSMCPYAFGYSSAPPSLTSASPALPISSS